ncbi:hypothetical protein F0521_24290 [Ferrimonas sp. YFM]|nr:hypothetical protein F0521_24290 [Ferrimonas sp. YFM]
MVVVVTQLLSSSSLMMDSELSLEALALSETKGTHSVSSLAFGDCELTIGY